MKIAELYLVYLLICLGSILPFTAYIMVKIHFGLFVCGVFLIMGMFTAERFKEIFNESSN